MYTKTKLRRAQNIDKFEEIYEKICTIYANDFAQKVNMKENKIKKKRLWLWLFVPLILIAILTLAFFCFSGETRMYIGLSGFVLLCFYPLFLLPTKKRPKEDSFSNIIKERLIGTLIKEMSPDLQYSPFAKNQKNILERYRTKGFKAGYEKCVEDEIIGTVFNNIDIKMYNVHNITSFNNTDIKMSNVHNITNTAKNSYTEFEGLFVEFTLNKNINADIRILLPTTNYIENPGNCQKLLMDNSNFEKEFNVYTNNKIIAHQILTSTVLEQLTSYYKNFEMTFELTLQNNEAAIRIETGTMFKSLTKEDLFAYYSVLNFTFDLIKDIYNIVENTDI